MHPLATRNGDSYESLYYKDEDTYEKIYEGCFVTRGEL